MMTTVDTLIHARWVIPVEPQGVILENHAVAIRNGNIVDIAPSQAAASLYAAAEIEKLTTHALIPGLVNAHTHSPMVLFRGLADDLPLMTWLTEHIWPAEASYLSEEFVREGTELAIAEMLRGGTTCFNEHYFYPEISAQTAMDQGIRAAIGLLAINVKTPWAEDADQCLEKGITALNTFNSPRFSHVNRELVTFTWAPHSPYMLDDKHLKQIQSLAQTQDLPIYMHLHETADEINNSLAKYQQRPLTRLHKLGLLSKKFQAVHMVHTSPEDIQILQQTGAHVIHCPESNLKLASGFCPIHALVNANINVALGTDGAASNNDLDMFSEMRTSALVAKAVANDPTVITASTALRMATLNGAKAMGLDKRIGSIEVGKAADLVAVDFQDMNSQPLYHPISQLVYATNSRQVSDVWIAGKRVLKESELCNMDKALLRDMATKWQAKIHQFC